MKIGILANCQGESVASCARAMSPYHTFEFISVTELWDDKRSIEDILRGCDKLYAQNMFRSQMPPEARDRVFYFPMMAFPAFHPDMAYLKARRIGSDAVETISNCMVMYHSAIVVTGYVSGLSVDDIIALFRPETFAKLGYFDAWEKARRELLAEGAASGLPLGALLEKWARRGCFMYSMNHPKLFVMEDLARDLLLRSGLPVVSHNVSAYLDDPLRLMSIWPVYPALADRLGLEGDYAFMQGMLQGTMDLRGFIEKCVADYAAFDRSSFDPIGFSIADYQEKLGLNGPREGRSGLAPTAVHHGNPYRSAQKNQFWKNSVSAVRPDQLDPVMHPRFKVGPSDRIATAGSCFAQHLARVLSQNGFNYYVTETAPQGMSPETAKEQNYNVYSARYGNVYTVRQLLQLFQRVDGSFVPQDEAWVDRKGRFVDPFRPQIQPEGYASREDMLAARETHFAAVRRMLSDMNVFVFTLGLTEGWRSRHDGAVFPLAPGVAGGAMDFDRYEFVNFDVNDIVRDMHAVIDRLSVINPSCRILLTVSPVPLIATYEPRHALVATTYSKSVLRAAADMIQRAYDHVEYFPSYEIITGGFNRGAYFEDDLRNVREEGVAHVMRVFMSHYTENGSPDMSSSHVENHDASPGVAPVAAVAAARQRSALFDVVCDEEAIANF